MDTLTFAKKVQRFYKGLYPPSGLPPGITAINPYATKDVRNCLDTFLNKYFSDANKRILVMGINPGRFGAGITGIPFTDPIALSDSCGIDNGFFKKGELSSQFVYSFIDEWGGVREFYDDFFLTAVSPIGFVKDGLNYNYYDDRRLFELVKPFIMRTLRQQHNCGVSETCIILGRGKNAQIFSRLNSELGLFKRIYAVEHPRFIMQYRRKKVRDYLDKYAQVFTQALSGEY